MPDDTDAPRPRLPDAWARHGAIRLDGPLEPASSDALFGVLTGLLGIFATFLLINVIIVPAVLTGQIVLVTGSAATSVMGNPEALIDRFAREFFIANSAGQWLGFAAITFVLARLHATNLLGFLRLRRTSGAAVVLATAGMVALLPVAQWLASLNAAIPMPEAVEAYDRQNLRIIEKVLEGDFGLVFNVLMLAVTPAICEELIFRGYAQRQFERAGPAVGVALSGVLFALYHLRPSQVLPLAAIGLYLAYLTWRTGSLWPAVAAHFANNAFIVFTAFHVERNSTPSSAVAGGSAVPGTAAAAGLVFFCAILYTLHRIMSAHLQARSDAEP